MIKFFKLVNGDEIVADVDDGDDWCEKFSLRRPYRNLIVNTQQGPAPMLLPYPCDEIEVKVAHVLLSGVPNDDLSNAYRSVTSGIVIPKHSKFQVPDGPERRPPEMP